MSTLEIVILLLVAAIVAALRFWSLTIGLPSTRGDRDRLRQSKRQWKELRRLEKRDPAAARAYGERIEAGLRAEYEALRDRADTDPVAAKEFMQSASDELRALRHMAMDFQRRATADPAAATTAAELQAEIRRVEADLARAQRVAL